MLMRNRRDDPRDPEDSGLIIREVVAHELGVSKINLHAFDGLISIGKDCQVRIWSYGLDLWGIIDCRHYDKDPLWYFPMSDKRERELEDIRQMQVMADEVREEDEQAVLVERNSDDDVKDEEVFTIEATFKKQQVTYEKKIHRKEEEARAYEKRIIDERTEFNRALEATKSKAEKTKFVPTVIRTKEQRAIDRIEHLLETDKKLNDSIINDEK